MTRLNFRKLLRRIEESLFFLTLLLLPTQFGKHFWPDFSFIYSIRTDYFSPVVYFWDIIVVLLVAVFFIRGGRFGKSSLSLFLIFIFTQVVSFAVSSNLGASVVRLDQYLITGFWGLYIASQNFGIISRVLWLGLGGAVIWSSLLAICQFILGKTVGFWILGERSFDLTTISIATFNWYGQVFLRPYATFPHPNVLAAFLIIGIVIVEWLKLEFKNSNFRFFYWLVLILGSSALFLTFSRVGVGLYSIFLLFIFRHRLKMLLILFLPLLPFLYVRFQSAFNFDQLSIIRREELATQSVRIWVTTPLFGVGLNNFIEKLAKLSVVSGEVRFLQPVHNIFLLSLVESGVLGLVGFLIFVGAAFYRVIRAKVANYFLVYCWVLVFGFGLFDHFFLTLSQGLRLFMLVWGLSMINLSGGSAEKSS